MPLVSVVMPVYNSAKYLGEAVESILAQTLSDFEFIIIDDGSTDGSGEMLDEYARKDDRIRVFHQGNRGVATSLNRGLEASRGKYIARMDADDISLPRRLEKQVEFMERHPKVGLCGTAWGYVGRRSGASMPITDPRPIRVCRLFWPCVAHPTVMMRGEIIAKHGLCYDPGFEQAQDYELWTRFDRHCETVNMPDLLLLYRVSETQATKRFEPEVRRWSEIVQRRLLAPLGIEPSGQEMRIHQSISKGRCESSMHHLAQVEEWLSRLLRANSAKGIYESEVMKEAFFEIWHEFCSSACETGLWTWPAFRESRLSEGRKIPARYAVSFLVRFLFRGRTRAAYHRLSRIPGVSRLASRSGPRGRAVEVDPCA